MKRLALVLFLSAGLTVTGISQLSAQQPLRTAARPQPASTRAAAPAAGTRVAVIDISYVFKNHKRFNESLEQVKQEIEAFEVELRNQQKAIMDMAEKLQPLAPNSPEYKRIEAEATREQVALQAKAQLKKKEVLEREAQYYFQAYQEILSAVQAVSSQHGIALVLRFDRDEMDPNDRTSVLKGVNRAVVLQRNLDITDIVLASLNR